ncbi:MAG: DUF5117 domain-containing protein, partial [Gemmatimonadaceae bacterium]|nr:DUF5117 domain-containing protein [Gemmatimonadaceae bacterium]
MRLPLTRPGALLGSWILLGAPLLIVRAQAPVTPIPSTASAPATTIAARTAGFERRDGFVPLHLDTKQGRLYAELPREPLRALFWVSLATGFGSNPVGLDRGASGSDQVVRFERDGDRVQMVFENMAFRTSLDDAAHRRSVDESFPVSTVAALPVLAEEGNRILVELTDVAYRDWNDIAGTMSRLNQGSYTLAGPPEGVGSARAPGDTPPTPKGVWGPIAAPRP